MGRAKRKILFVLDKTVRFVYIVCDIDYKEYAMATTSGKRAILVRMKPWVMGGAIVGLLLWNMKQCSSLDKEHAANEAQDAKIAQVDSVVNDSDNLARNNNIAIRDLIAAIDAVNQKADNNTVRIDSVESRVDSLSARVDSIKPCPCDQKVAKPKQKAKVAKKKSGVEMEVKSNAPIIVEENTTAQTPAAPQVQQNVSVVGVNNGTVNNYYNAPAANEGTVKISSSASITTIVRVVKTR